MIAESNGNGGLQNVTPKKAAFLAAYLETATVHHAAIAAGITRKTHYEWVKDDPSYAAAFEEAKEAAIDVMEAEARRRAIQGVRRLKFGKDGAHIDPDTGQPYEELQYSDNLLMFLLKAARPEVYRDNYQDEQRETTESEIVMVVVEDPKRLESPIPAKEFEALKERNGQNGNGKH